jgi:AAA family ATP:ADP antiporter
MGASVSLTEDHSERKNIAARALSIFAPVRPGEAGTALLLMLSMFVLLTAYYIIKPVREALILDGPGAEIKSYAGAAQALLFLIVLPLYSALASRINRIWLINGVTAFFISNLVLFYLLGRMHFQLGVPFFLWVGMFNVMLVAQFWAFANDVYTEERGKRLFAIIGIGSSLGGIFGAQIAGRLFQPLGPYRMMLTAAALLAICMVLLNWIHRREGTTAGRRTPTDGARRPLGTSGGFRLVLAHRYLLLIAVLVLLSNFVNTTGEFILGKTVAHFAKTQPNSQAYIGEFYAGFFFWVNVVGAGLQLFAVSRIIKHLGIGCALFFLPVIALGSYTLLAFAPLLSFIRIAKVAENSADYSIQNTARHALFLNTSREAKYKAQSAIDSFFWRAGDGFSALLVFIGTRLEFDIRSFAAANALFVLIWLSVAVAIVRLRKEEQMVDVEAGTRAVA